MDRALLAELILPVALLSPAMCQVKPVLTIDARVKVDSQNDAFDSAGASSSYIPMRAYLQASARPASDPSCTDVDFLLTNTGTTALTIPLARSLDLTRARDKVIEADEFSFSLVDKLNNVILVSDLFSNPGYPHSTYKLRPGTSVRVKTRTCKKLKPEMQAQILKQEVTYDLRTVKKSVFYHGADSVSTRLQIAK